MMSATESVFKWRS